MKQTSTKKNLIYQMLYEILVIILPLITSPYIARVIGADGLGIYSYSYSVAYYFVLVSMLGLKNYGNRTIAKVRENQELLSSTFSNILILHISISVICTVAYIGYCFILKEDRVYAFIQIAYVLSGLFDISWFYFGIEKFKLTVTRSTIIKIVNVICIFVFVRESSDLWKYCLIMSLGMFISQITLWIPLKKYVSITKPNIKEILPHIKPLLILFIPAIAVSLYKYMDKIMIGSLSTKVQLGLYENAEKVNNIPLTVIGAFGTVMLPKMSNLAAKKDKEAALRYMSISMQFVMCLAFSLAFGLAGVGNVFALIFWGKEFISSGTIIMGLSITIPFISFANVIRTQYLIPNGKDKDYLVSVIAGAVVNLVINFLLIPVLKAYGATIGTIAAEVVVCVIQTYSVRKELPVKAFIKSFIVFILFGTIMFGTVYMLGIFFKHTVWLLLLQILLGVAIYGSLALYYFIKTHNTIILNLLNNIKQKVR